MSIFKSKFPNLDDLGNMAAKFFKDMKTSVCEIVDEYQQKKRTREEIIVPETVVRPTASNTKATTGNGTVTPTVVTSDINPTTNETDEPLITSEPTVTPEPSLVEPTVITEKPETVVIDKDSLPKE